MNLDVSQQEAFALMESGANVFLTGVAGSGKSHVVTSFLGGSFRRVDITATTGIAALNLQQQIMDRSGRPSTVRTIYSWAGIGLGPQGRQSIGQYIHWLESSGAFAVKNARRRIRGAAVLIIDEISMFPGKVFDLLDQWCRRVRSNEEPFGGIQVITVGDFLQLPPVSKTGVYDWAFKARAWQEAYFQTVLLRQVHRQDEKDFVALLNEFREGRMSRRGSTLLASRVAQFPSRIIPRLLTHNTQVNNWNRAMLADIEAPEHTLTASWGGRESQRDQLRKNLTTPEQLQIKVGARVITTANKTKKGELLWVNGQMGTVADVSHDCVMVRFDNGQKYDIERHKFQFDPQDDDSATMEQFPLRLAYALTIHKSQGLTLPRAYIDIRAAREPGQAYVALSRVKTLAGVHLKDWIKGFVYSPDALAFYQTMKNYDSPIIKN